jgi:hypothetical protein
MGSKKVRTCKTSIVISLQKCEFCGGVAGRIWKEMDVGPKCRGLTIDFMRKGCALVLQKHGKPIVQGVFLMHFRAFFARFLCALG